MGKGCQLQRKGRYKRKEGNKTKRGWKKTRETQREIKSRTSVQKEDFRFLAIIRTGKPYNTPLLDLLNGGWTKGQMEKDKEKEQQREKRDDPIFRKASRFASAMNRNA